MGDSNLQSVETVETNTVKSGIDVSYSENKHITFDQETKIYYYNCNREDVMDCNENYTVAPEEQREETYVDYQPLDLTMKYYNL